MVRRGKKIEAGVWEGVLSALRTDRWVQVLLLVLAFTAFSRFIQPDWYGSRQFHPDERWLFQKTAELSYPGEPGRASGDSAGLQYGSLPLYIVATAKDFARALVPGLDVNHFVMVAGRMLSGLADTLSVLLVFLIGAKLWDRRTGLMAAALLAFAPVHIQLSHFFTVDPLLAAGCLACLYACAAVLQGGGWAWSGLAGAFAGAAMASKSSSLLLVIPILVAHGFRLWDLRLTAKSTQREEALNLVYGLGISAISLLLVFFISMPWALLDMEKFLRNQAEQRAILVTGSPMGTPYVRQYWDTTPVFFHLKNVLLYYQGWLPGALGLIAFAYYLVKPAFSIKQLLSESKVQSSKSRVRLRPPAPGPQALDRHTLLLLSWMVPYLLVVGFAFAKFARYMLPFIPFLCLLGAHLAAEAWQRWQASRRALAVAGLLVLLSALGAACGYLATYFRPHPWIAASEWIYANVPPTQPADAPALPAPPQKKNAQPAPAATRPTSILNETWGDDLPVDVKGKNNGQYRNWQVNIVEWDSPRKLQEFGQKLSQSDLVVMGDARAYGTYLRLPHRFPLTYAYYHLMFTHPEKLGFERAHESANFPGFLGWSSDDSRTLDKPRLLWADESFTLYDHPRSFLFRRTANLDSSAIQSALLAHWMELKLPDSWTKGGSPEDNLRQAQGSPAAQADASQDASLVNPNIGLSRGAIHPWGATMPVFAWWSLLALLTLLALPLASNVFSAFPDRGVSLAKPLGLLLFAWAAFWLASLKILYFHQSGLALLLVLALAVLALGASRRRSQVSAWWAAQKKEVFWSEGLFAAAFLFFCIVKAYNPDVHDIGGQGYNGGGEPLGMTYLSALTRCATFPAYDPWLALSSSSYYYFGYEIAATLAKLSGIPVSTAYNLCLAMFFALTVLAAYGVGLALTGRRKFALWSAAAVACFGSLWTLPYLVIQAGNTAQSLLGFAGQLAAQTVSWAFMWDPTRFPQLVNGYIFEFPYFSYLYSDLHPHNMVIPFFLLLVALLLAPFKSALTGWRAFGKSLPQLSLYLLLTGLAVDVQYGINTWNWPFVLALGGAAFLVAGWAGRAADGREKAAAALTGLLLWPLTAGLGILLMWPFRAHFARGVSHLGWVQQSEWVMGSYIPAAFFAFGLLGLFSLAPQRFSQWVSAFEKPLNLVRLRRLPAFDRMLRLLRRASQKLPLRLGILGAAVLVLLLFLLLTLAGVQHGGVFWMATGLALACLACLVLLADSRREGGEEAFVWVMGFVAMAAVAGTEIIFVADRMNTIFKFWIQAWVLMGLVFGYGAFRSFEALRAPAPAVGHGRVRRLRPGLGNAWQGPAAAVFFVLALLAAAIVDNRLGTRYGLSFLVLGGLFTAGWWFQAWPSDWTRGPWKGAFYALLFLGFLYPAGATLGRTLACSGWSHPHLDGMKFMETMEVRSTGLDNFDYDRHDAGAIRWLNEHADKTEPILEAPGREMYKGFSRYAIYTGLPTLIGWKYQEGQQLGENAGERIEDRDRDASLIYSTADMGQAVTLLKQYRVRWVAVGSIEKKLYPAQGLAKFPAFCKAVYQDEGAALYEVPEDLTPTAAVPAAVPQPQ
jgi:YYY domain-containing protein